MGGFIHHISDAAVRAHGAARTRRLPRAERAESIGPSGVAVRRELVPARERGGTHERAPTHEGDDRQIIPRAEAAGGGGDASAGPESGSCRLTEQKGDMR